MRFCDLVPRAQGVLLDRLGLWFEVEERAGPLPNDVWESDLGYEEGPRLFFRSPVELHNLLHEAGHLLALPAPLRESFGWFGSKRDIPSSEEVAMVYQVELCRRIPGLGIRGMLLEMVDHDYNFTPSSARYWWQRVAKPPLPPPTRKSS